MYTDYRCVTGCCRRLLVLMTSFGWMLNILFVFMFKYLYDAYRLCPVCVAYACWRWMWVSEVCNIRPSYTKYTEDLDQVASWYSALFWLCHYCLCGFALGCVPLFVQCAEKSWLPSSAMANGITGIVMLCHVSDCACGLQKKHSYIVLPFRMRWSNDMQLNVVLCLHLCVCVFGVNFEYIYRAAPDFTNWMKKTNGSIV